MRFPKKSEAREIINGSEERCHVIGDLMRSFLFSFLLSQNGFYFNVKSSKSVRITTAAVLWGNLSVCSLLPGHGNRHGEFLLLDFGTSDELLTWTLGFWKGKLDR